MTEIQKKFFNDNSDDDNDNNDNNNKSDKVKYNYQLHELERVLTNQ